MSYATLPADQTYAYTYDDNGNILSATFGDYSYSYVYDSQNQLIRENNSKLGRTYTWEYDNAGNILSRSTYAYTTGELGEATATIQYRYEDADWGDMLTGIASHTLTYDEIGNMLTFGPRTFTWEHGRQLASQTINGVTWTYTYDSNGMRTGRTNGTNTYEYIYNGSKLMRMVRNGVVVDFTYINGIPATLTFNGNTFYYVVNGQGDVTGITDSSGNLQLSYYYDAWGNSSYTVASGAEYASTLLTINPLLYRGYVLDREVGMYYLQSRYYIPEIGRFINADGYTSTGQGFIGNNMFAYCLNDPIKLYDPSGSSATSIKDLIKPVAVAAVVLVKVVTMFKNTVVHFSNEMDVCTDGKFCNDDLNEAEEPYGDKNHYGHTARLDGICADCVNYMVIPGDYPNGNDLLGCVGVIINNQTGKSVYAVVCEIGPKENSGGYGASAWDEVSIRAAWLLNGHEPGVAIANSRQYGGFTFIIFANSKQKWDTDSDLQAQIDAVGKLYWP